MNTRLALIAVTLLALPGTAAALDYVSLTRDGKPIHIVGKVLTEAVDGGVLVLDRQGILWAVQATELSKRTNDATPYQPMQREELQEKLVGELPAFQVHATKHYVICYNTSPAYAQWCGALYERLYRAFHNYWERRGLKLRDPDMPLTALVFATKANYGRYARPELGDATSNIVGYYSLRTNRVTMYDLTGTSGLQGVGGRLTTTTQINRLLMQPGAERMVATIIHEATHQIAYNCGLHNRYADIPLWISEGLAIYFETPDLRSKQGWRNIGGVNRHRLDRFRRMVRQPDSLKSLIADDDCFRKPQTALDAYAEAWAFNYFLINRRLDAYVKYLRVLADKQPLVYDAPEERYEKRLEAFTDVFGDDFAELDADFLRYMRTVR
jgi:hypothetical protein